MNKLMMACIALGMSFSLLAEPAKKESVQTLMQMSGAGEMGKMMMDQMMPVLKQQIPDASEEFWKDIESEMNMDELMANIIPVYQQHLSEEDVQAALAFYATPSGKKLLASQPVIMQQSMQIGQQWGQKLFISVMQKHQMMKEQANK